MSEPENPEEFYLPEYAIRAQPDYPAVPFEFVMVYDFSSTKKIMQIVVRYEGNPIAEIFVHNDEQGDIVWQVDSVRKNASLQESLDKIFHEYPRHSLEAQISCFRDHRDKLLALLRSRENQYA